MHIKQEMVDFVINLLNNKIPDIYYYHNTEHTLYVMHNVAEIAKAEKCTEKEIELLKTAALWHDTGYINTYQGHEEESYALAQQYLPGYGYAAEDTSRVCGMIMATKIPQSPKNKLEKIIADADLAYLGTERAAILANNLFKELNALNPLLTKDAWNKTEIGFLQNHHYFTPYCKEHRQPKKLLYLRSLIAATG